MVQRPGTKDTEGTKTGCEGCRGGMKGAKDGCEGYKVRA